MGTIVGRGAIPLTEAEQEHEIIYMNLKMTSKDSV